RKGRGGPVSGAGGGKNELLHAGIQHRVQQVQRGVQVVEVVLQRVGDRLADVAVGGEVHHQLDLLLGDQLLHPRLVAQVELVERHGGGHRAAVPVHQVVQDDRTVPGSDQLPQAMTSDITRSSNDKDVHRISVVLPSGAAWLAISSSYPNEASSHR